MDRNMDQKLRIAMLGEAVIICTKSNSWMMADEEKYGLETQKCRVWEECMGEQSEGERVNGSSKHHKDHRVVACRVECRGLTV